MKLSLAMIVKDEALNLGKCLDSVKGLVDEMVVLDTGSTDGTVEIAKAYGARVEQFTWTGSFAEARNKSLSLCTGDWIFVIDADEMLNPREHQAIRQAIEVPEVMGYKLWKWNYVNTGSVFGLGNNVKTNSGGFEPAAECSHYAPQRDLRLIRNLNSPEYVGRVHEWLEPWFEKHGYIVHTLEVIIHHFGKIDVQRDLAKQHVYLELARREALENPGDPVVHGNVLQEALMLEDWSTVLESAQTYLKLKGAAPVLVHLGGAKALIESGRPGEALDFLAPIDDQAAPDPAVLDMKAEAFQSLGMVQEAVDACLLSMDTDPGYTAPYIRLSRILDSEGDMENARKVLEAGLDQNTRDIRLWEALVGLSSKHRDARVTQDAWHAIQAAPKGGQGIWHMLVAQVLKGQGDIDEAISVLEMGLVSFPDNLEIMAMKEIMR
ncbi:MAG: glycosyltransferase [Holophagales bacterium]|jgi:tetratricopeptide (TPR) repeat protein|nr:glycosyltransferase [Holophagales bacterium]